MEYGQSIKIKAPATIANMVCGFDILGFAVAEPYDEMTITLKKEPGISIVHTDDHQLPTEPNDNVAGVALQAMLSELTMPVGFDVIIHKHIKPGSGLGSSAASAAGAVVAANYLLGEVFNKESLVQFAMHGEKLASGVKHADNITPCIYGGITLIRSIFPLDIIPLQPPPLFVTIVHPQIEVKTADARSILKKQVYLKDAIKQWGNIAGLVSGLLQSDYALIGRSLEDVLIEPVRSILIPGFDEIKERSKSVGALGGGISGSGPSVFMLSRSLETAQLVEIQMKAVFQQMNLLHYTYVTTVSSNGVQLFSA
ncbi:MAG: homoserine kinase [Sediminibacterium sp.]|jgi:homoserine kinase|uniref:homoserine kinase n=1 Tax=Sediminibacterium sp. TaxID=1917865 RepID=UPI002ABAE855|nr:homoserine kinase [Sediminibacterium sp.]MDZ4072159.1 homoserine kinase [Sediminibacterium sp.]